LQKILLFKNISNFTQEEIMKTQNKVFLATAVLMALYSTPGWSEPRLKLTQSDAQDEIVRLKKNIETNYRDIKSINDLGVVHLKSGHYGKAIAQFKKALEVAPRYTLGPVLSGNIYTDAENYQGKIKEFQEVIKMNREYARSNNYLGLAYLQQKNYSTAKFSLLEAVKINPKYAKAHNNLGVLYEETGETVKAIESYQTAHRVDPDNPDSLFNLGLAYDVLEDGENSVFYMVLAKKTHERKSGQEGIDRISDKLDHLWAKYADNTENESVASLDSNITGGAGSPTNTFKNQTSITSSVSSFTPLDLSQTSGTIGASISYETPRALTVKLKPQSDLTILPVTPVSENHQGKTNSGSVPITPVELHKLGEIEGSMITSALSENNELTAESNIKESTFNDSQGTYTHPGVLSESEEKVETAATPSKDIEKKVDTQKPQKKTWVSDWVFDYPK
jgi:tetratricopeptide (TPR) repeat protein